MQQQQQMQEQQTQAQQQMQQQQLEAESSESEKERQKDILIAEIRAAGYGSMVDLDKNNQNDYRDEMSDIRKTEQYNQQTNIQRQKLSDDMVKHSQKMTIEEQRIEAQKDIADKQLQIARENKNKYDVKPTSAKKKK